ncbi:MAG: aminoglycoside phosphotransferase family protein [Myxococcaceae bacterium]
MPEDDRVHPLLDVSRAAIDAVAARALGAPVARVEPLRGGLSHTLFDVTTTDGSRSVFRFCAGSVERFERERRLLLELAPHLPVPKLRWSGVVEHPVLVLGFVEAEPFWKIRKEHPDQVEDLAGPLARLLVSVAAAPVVAGPPLPEARVKYADDPIALTVERLGSEAVRERAGASLCDQLIRTYQGAAGLRSLGAKRLCHGDLSLRNVLLRPHAGTWEIAALIDWDEPFDATPLWDVGQLFRYRNRFPPRFISAFERAYRDAGGALADDWWRSSRLVDAMRFIDTLWRPRDQPAVFAELRALLTDLVIEA